MTRRSSGPLSCVSLFTGAGGMDYGFEAAGFETVAAVEMDADCCSTIRRNRDWRVFDEPLEGVPSYRLLEAGRKKAGEVDLLIGGPPCQPFSKSAYWVKGDTLRLQDPRANTLFEYLRCVNDLLPRVFVLENVYGISYSGKEEGLSLLMEETEKINRAHGTKYTCSWSVLNAAEYGVPQIRQRFFLVAHRDGGIFRFPHPTHQLPETEAAEDQFTTASADADSVTAWDAIGHLNADRSENLRVRGRWADLLPSIPEGENYLWHTNRKGGMPLFGWRTRYWSFLLKLAKNRPSWTIQAQPGPAIGPFHWENRLLSVSEMAALQTFPKDTSFHGGRGSIQRQIGNAVPALIAEILGREIRRQFFGHRIPSKCALAVPRHRPIPEPEPVAKVPKQFRSLVGDHEDHPGTSTAAKLRRTEAVRRNGSRNGNIQPALEFAQRSDDDTEPKIRPGN